MTTIRCATITAAFAALTLAVAAPAAASAEKPLPSTVQYIAYGSSYTYTACYYDRTFIAGSAYQGGTNEIYYVRIHSNDTCTGAIGYTDGEGRTTTGTVKITGSLSKALIDGQVPLNNGTTVAVYEEFTATGKAQVIPTSVGIRTQRPAAVQPGTWTDSWLYKVEMFPPAVTS